MRGVRSRKCHVSATAVKRQSLLASHLLLLAIGTSTEAALEDMCERVMTVWQIKRDFLPVDEANVVEFPISGG